MPEPAGSADGPLAALTETCGHATAVLLAAEEAVQRPPTAASTHQERQAAAVQAPMPPSLPQQQAAAAERCAAQARVPSSARKHMPPAPLTGLPLAAVEEVMPGTGLAGLQVRCPCASAAPCMAVRALSGHAPPRPRACVLLTCSVGWLRLGWWCGVTALTRPAPLAAFFPRLLCACCRKAGQGCKGAPRGDLWYVMRLQRPSTCPRPPSDLLLRAAPADP